MINSMNFTSPTIRTNSASPGFQAKLVPLGWYAQASIEPFEEEAQKAAGEIGTEKDLIIAHIATPTIVKSMSKGTKDKLYNTHCVFAHVNPDGEVVKEKEVDIPRSLMDLKKDDVIPLIKQFNKQ